MPVLRFLVSTSLAVALIVFGLGSARLGAADLKYDSPQAAFAAAQAANAKDDWPALCRTLTPESRDTLAGGLVAAQVVLADFIEAFAKMADDERAQAETERKIGAMKRTLQRHGLDADKIKAQLAAGAAPEDPNVQRFPRLEIPKDKKTLLKLAEPIKDRDAFIADSMEAVKTYGAKGGGPPQLGKDARLQEVKIDGDTATARVLVKTSLGNEEGRPLTFRKIDGGWRVELPMQIE